MSRTGSPASSELAQGGGTAGVAGTVGASGTAGVSGTAITARGWAPRGLPCQACGATVEPGDRFCAACGCPVTERPETARTAVPQDAHPVEAPGVSQREVSLSQPSVGTGEESAPQRFFRCRSCGSEVATDPTQRSYACPFCDSSYVVEFSPEQSGRHAPEFIIGFSVPPETAQDLFRQWIRHNAWFRPSGLHLAGIEEKLRGIYLPFWSFSMLADSDWSAQIGEHWYRTETYWTTDSKGNRVQHTRQVQETEWWPLDGKHHQYYSGYLVSGSRGLSQMDAERIMPYQLPALKRYEPLYLAGWLCEEYSVPRQQALEICQRTFYQREAANVASFMPGDTHSNLRVSTQFLHVQEDLCLLPVYVLSYRFGDRLYRFLINGQTGKVAGDKPVSGRRIAAAIGIVIMLCVLLGLAMSLIGLLR